MSTPEQPDSPPLTRKQMRDIAEIKLADMNTKDIDSIISQIAGTARQMGVEVES